MAVPSLMLCLLQPPQRLSVAACYSPHLLVPVHFVPPNKSNITSLNTLLFRPNGINLPGSQAVSRESCGRSPDAAQCYVADLIWAACKPRRWLVAKAPSSTNGNSCECTTPPGDLVTEPVKFAIRCFCFLDC